MAKKKSTQKKASSKSTVSKRKKTAKKARKKTTTKRVRAQSMSSMSTSSTHSDVNIGKMSFLFGLGLSIIVGLIVGLLNLKMTLGVGITFAIIFILGLLVGLLNITTKEVNEFLIASIAFMAAAGVNVFVISLTLPTFGGIVKQIFFALSIIVAPAATVVAFKAMYELAKNK